MPRPISARSSWPTAALAAAMVLGLTVAASAQDACGVPPSGLVRLWAGLGCQGQTDDVTATRSIAGFPAYSIANGTGQWIALTDTADPSQADHTLLIESGCYYGNLSLFRWQSGRSWVGNIRAIQILPPGTDPSTYPASGDKVIGQCN